ncbi:MAG: hypothetical protein HY246_05565 [Proteobacteria bacterium]|nr:hypothetical protein [Pseudomonadota bacterium]
MFFLFVLASCGISAASLAQQRGPDNFRVIDLCNSKPCTPAEVANKLSLVRSPEERYAPDAQGYLKITLKFSKSVDPSTVVVGKTLVIDTPLDHAAGGAILWLSNERDGLMFVAAKPRAQLFPPGKDNIDFKLILRGNDHQGSGVIRATDGSVLHGQRGGLQEGDYQVHYVCAQLDPFWCR